MNQTTSMILAAFLGVALSVASPAPLIAEKIFIYAVSCGWLGMGLYALVRGEISVAGRGGKSPKIYNGVTARIIGIVIIAMFVAFGLLGYYLVYK